MSIEILVNVAPRETRAAILENGVVQEIHIERTSRRGLVRSMCSSCTTPFSRIAARVSRGATFTRISMLTRPAPADAPAARTAPRPRATAPRSRTAAAP